MRDLKKFLKLRLEAERQAASLPALMLEAENIATSIMHGEHAKRKTGTGQKFWQFRDYVAGDRPQDIDWRQSAKTDHVYIRQKELQTTQKTYLWCAAGKGMDYRSQSHLRTKQERAHVIILSLALMLMHAEEQIGIFGESKTGRSEKKLEHITQALLQIDRNEYLPPIDHFILPRHSMLFQAGDFLSPLENIAYTFSKIAATAEKSCVIQILDPSELELDFEGRVLFENENAQESEIINHVASIRSAYQERIQNHIEGIQKLCRQHNWIYILHRTDSNITDTLNALWLRASKHGDRA